MQNTSTKKKDADCIYWLPWKHPYWNKGTRQFFKSFRELPVITEPVAFGRERRKKLRKKKEAEEEYEKLYGVDRSTAKLVIGSFL